MLTLPLAILCFLIGILIGVAGVGGVLLIAVLVYLGGLGIHEAMASSLFSFFFSGIIATFSYQRYGSIDWKITIPVCAGSFFSSYIGALVNAVTSPMVLNLVLGVVVTLSSLYSMKAVPSINFANSLVMRKKLYLLVGIGLFVGFFCGFAGIGGGLISIPLMLIAGFNPLASIATGQVMQSIVSISASVSNLQNGFVVFPLIWWVIGIELLGVGIGVVIAHKIPVDKLKKSTSLFCLLFGLAAIAKAFL